jgi:hypothetical protein
MAIKEFEGAHGTTLNKYAEIKKTGFFRYSGLAGYGIYFWIGIHCISLAKEWCICNKKIKMSDCVVIIANIKVDDVNYLDLETLEMKDSIYRLIIKLKLDINDKDKKAKLYDSFIKDIEKMINNEIHVYQIRLPAPKKSTYPYEIIGTPFCCVVRNNKCIFNIRQIKCLEV